MLYGHSQSICKLYPTAAASAVGSMPVPDGMIQYVGPSGSASSRLIGILTAASGDIASSNINHFKQSAVYRNAAPGTYEDLTVRAGAGHQLWIFVRNETGSSIPRGTPVKWAAAADSVNEGHIVAMTATDPAILCVGVTQWTVPTGNGTFVLRYGPGKILHPGGGGATERGKAIKSGAGNGVTAAATDPGFARWAVDDLSGAAGLYDCFMLLGC